MAVVVGYLDLLTDRGGDPKPYGYPLVAGFAYRVIGEGRSSLQTRLFTVTQNIPYPDVLEDFLYYVDETYEYYEDDLRILVTFSFNDFLLPAFVDYIGLRKSFELLKWNVVDLRSYLTVCNRFNLKVSFDVLRNYVGVFPVRTYNDLLDCFKRGECTYKDLSAYVLSNLKVLDRFYFRVRQDDAPCSEVASEA